MADELDFKAALEGYLKLEYHDNGTGEEGFLMEDLCNWYFDNHKAIQTALKLAERMQQGDVSDCMDLEAFKCETRLSEHTAYNDIFKAMAQQMIREVQDEG